MLSLSQEDFLRLVNFVHKNFGIDLSKKKQLIVSRLSYTISNLGFKDFTSYVDYITTTKNTKDIDIMLNKLTTNYTYFLREHEHFDFFQKTVLPYLEQKHSAKKVLSIWSAGCSSGEEPYTISMYLKEYFGSKPGNWDTRVLATDISQNVLNAAKQARYIEESLKDVPEAWKKKYFQKIPGTDDEYTVSPAIKQNVIFRTFNLMDPIRFKLKFDLIFCRNVMIYFDQPTKDALIQRFYEASNPGAYLMIGHSESVNKESTKYKYIMPAIYHKQEAGRN